MSTYCTNNENNDSIHPQQTSCPPNDNIEPIIRTTQQPLQPAMRSLDGQPSEHDTSATPPLRHGSLVIIGGFQLRTTLLTGAFIPRNLLCTVKHTRTIVPGPEISGSEMSEIHQIINTKLNSRRNSSLYMPGDRSDSPVSIY